MVVTPNLPWQIDPTKLRETKSPADVSINPIQETPAEAKFRKSIKTRPAVNPDWGKSYMEDLDRTFGDYQSQLSYGMQRSGLYGGGSYIKAIRKLDESRKAEEGKVTGARDFVALQQQIQDLTKQFEQEGQRVAQIKKEISGTLFNVPGEAGYDARMRSKHEAEKKMAMIQSQLDTLVTESQQYVGNPFVGEAATGLQGLPGGIKELGEKVSSYDPKGWFERALPSLGAIVADVFAPGIGSAIGGALGLSNLPFAAEFGKIGQGISAALPSLAMGGEPGESLWKGYQGYKKATQEAIGDLPKIKPQDTERYTITDTQAVGSYPVNVGGNIKYAAPKLEFSEDIPEATVEEVQKSASDVKSYTLGDTIPVGYQLTRVAGLGKTPSLKLIKFAEGTEASRRALAEDYQYSNALAQLDVTPDYAAWKDFVSKSVESPSVQSRLLEKGLSHYKQRDPAAPKIIEVEANLSSVLGNKDYANLRGQKGPFQEARQSMSTYLEDSNRGLKVRLPDEYVKNVKTGKVFGWTRTFAYDGLGEDIGNAPVDKTNGQVLLIEQNGQQFKVVVQDGRLYRKLR